LPDWNDWNDFSAVRVQSIDSQKRSNLPDSTSLVEVNVAVKHPNKSERQPLTKSP